GAQLPQREVKLRCGSCGAIFTVDGSRETNGEVAVGAVISAGVASASPKVAPAAAIESRAQSALRGARWTAGAILVTCGVIVMVGGVGVIIGNVTGLFPTVRFLGGITVALG